MIQHLSLTNFQKHENLRLDFGSGLNLLKGSNEAGKSTVMRAVVYAFFGAAALPLTLAETVTWGKPESTLKVELAFRHDDTDYTIRRGKSGAEMQSDGQLVSGQMEVTRAVERMFGVSAGLAAKLMLANQGALRGALTDGTAVQLIEQLADFDLIEKIVDKIQTHMPSGSVAALEQQVAQMDQPQPEDGRDVRLWQTLRGCQETQEESLETEANLEKLRAELDVPYATEVLAKAARLENSQNANSAWLARTNALLVSALPDKPTLSLEAYKAMRAEAVLAHARWVGYQKYLGICKLVEPVGKLPSLDLLVADIKRTAALVDAHQKHLNGIEKTIALATQRQILAGSCEWCSKDLTSVEAVATHNRLLLEQLQVLEVSRSVAEEDLANAKGRLEKLREDRDLLSHCESLAFGCVYIQKTAEGFEWVETGPRLEELGGDQTGLWAARWENYNKAAQARAAAEEQASALKKALARDFNALQELPVQDAQETIAEAARLDLALKECQAQLVALTRTRSELEQQAAVQQATYESEQASWKRSQEQLAGVKALLADTRANNHVIKRVREVRPAVAAKLWAVVLQAVSQLFSSVRGSPSVVVREGSDFLVDGHTAKALSGSTLDSLGLAIRLGLTKTFLPNTRFLLVDEPAAGMDDDRESAMLALLSSCDLDQVIMITHSPLADTFATNITEI